MLLIVTYICGCRQGRERTSVDSVNALAAYLRNPENGLVKEHAYNELVWRVSLVPREGLGARGQGLASTAEDEVNGNGTLHFMVNISAGAVYEAGDVMMAGVANYEEYADRMIQMNFRLEESTRLHVGGKILTPRLCHMENTFGLSQDRNIHMIFSDDALLPELNALPKLDLVIEDWVFGTGISHFVFQEENLQKIPVLQI